MANSFKLRLSEFFIKTKNGPLEDNIYDDEIKEYKIEQIQINRVPSEEMEKEFPRFLIGYNSDYLNLFLELLQNGKEECKREVLNLLEILPINIDYKLYIREGILKFGQGNKSLTEW